MSAGHRKGQKPTANPASTTTTEIRTIPGDEPRATARGKNLERRPTDPRRLGQTMYSKEVIQ